MRFGVAVKVELMFSGKHEFSEIVLCLFWLLHCFVCFNG